MDVLRTPFHRDIPNAFEQKNSEDIKDLKGAYAKLIALFANHSNYKLELVPDKIYKVSTMQKNIERGIYNISMHGGFYNNTFANITFSYPVEWGTTCIMVPAEDELPSYLYVVWPFGRYIWTVLGITIIYVAYLMKYLKHPSISFAKNLLYSLVLILYSGSTNLAWLNLSLRLQYFYGLIIILGFILSSYYNSFLTAYTMRPIFQPYIRTINDLLNANIKLLIPSDTREELRNNEYVDLSELTPITIEMSPGEVSDKVRNLSRSFAYVITLNEWLFITKLQGNIVKPIYQLSDICIGKRHNAFPIQLESKFAESLNHFILRVHQAGLWEQWKEEAFVAALSLKYFLIPRDHYALQPLDLKYFKIGWLVLIVGLVVSTFCVILELLIYKYEKKIKMKFKT